MNLALMLSSLVGFPHTRPTVAYTLRLDPTHLDVLEVQIHVERGPPTFHLAMKVHAEYDARYWRYVDEVRVEGTAGDSAARVTREDSTLWRVWLPGGHGTIRYRVHVQPPPAAIRRAWMPYVRADGALINPPDVFLYLPELASAAVTLHLDLPAGWRVATAFHDRGGLVDLLDSPILAGSLRQWSFVNRGTTYHVVYWPLPTAAVFDTSAFVTQLRRLTDAALDIFGSAPTPEYYFLIQDGADDALEHGGSVTIGVTSERLAREPRAALSEIAHEFFHTWNLVAIHPVGYNTLDYRAPRRTPSLWFGEGVTLHYADVLPRREGLADSSPTRLEHLASLLERYYGSPATLRVSPERASLAFGDSPVSNPDATGGYYLQGELLADVIDARLRSTSAGRRGLDDAMRALYARSRVLGDSGYTSRDLEAVMDSVCTCDMSGLFADQVRGIGPVDVTPVLTRVGLRLLVDTVPATKRNGEPRPDLRLGIDFAASSPAGVVRLAIGNPTTVWAGAGLRTGDQLVAMSGAPIGSFDDLQAALQALHVGDRAVVEIRRDGQPLTITVPMTGYMRPRVQFVDAGSLTPEQRSRRQEWLAGR